MGLHWAVQGLVLHFAERGVGTPQAKPFPSVPLGGNLYGS